MNTHCQPSSSVRFAAAPAPASLCPVGHCHLTRQNQLLLIPARRRTALSTRTEAFGQSAAFAATSGTAWVSSAASALGFTIGALWILRGMIMEQERSDSEGDIECPTCGGTGYVECICTRWSDGDSGCATCRGTLKMTCNGCGGTGTGIPLTARVMARRSGPLINMDR